MTETNAEGRIEAAIARIEAAATARRTESAAITRRHETLKAQVGEAIASLDAVLAQRGAD